MVGNVLVLFVELNDLSPRPGLVPHIHRVAEQALDRVREMLCGLQGHQHLLQFQRDRMFLRCLSCGHESSGWKLKEERPRQRP